MARTIPAPEGWALPPEWLGCPAAHLLLPLLLDVIASIKAHAADDFGAFQSLLGLNSLHSAQIALDSLRGHVTVFGEEGARPPAGEPVTGRPHANTGL